MEDLLGGTKEIIANGGRSRSPDRQRSDKLYLPTRSVSTGRPEWGEVKADSPCMILELSPSPEIETET